MPYFPINPSNDDRHTRGITPMRLRNCLVEEQPTGANKRSKYLIGPTPGRSRVATFSSNTRGLFCQPGVQNATLFAAYGSTVATVSSAWSAAGVGTIFGGDTVNFVGLRASLALRAFQSIHTWDGSTFGTVTDPNAPTNPSTLASVGNRILAADGGGDTFAWSKAGLPLDWDPSGIAADVNLPDPIVGQNRVRGDLWSFNSRSIQPWSATGGSEAEAFIPVPGVQIETGLMARDSVAILSDGRAAFLGADRVVYLTSGFGLSAISDDDITLALKAFTDAQLASARGWSYKDGTKEFYGLNFGAERAIVYDLSTRLWHERTRYGSSAYDIDFMANAYGEVVCASNASTYLWKLDPDVYMDDTSLIQRQMTVHIPTGALTDINRIVLDVQFFDQPLTGQGSAPTMILDYSKDGGQTWSTDSGTQREISLPANGQLGKRIQAFQFGRARPEYGFLLRLTLTDPIGFALSGIWVNPDPDREFI